MTMTNAEWCIKNNIKFQEIHVPYDAKAKEAKIIYRNKEIGRSKFCDTSFTTLKVWLDMEHVDPILDDVERKYLSAVIKPFRKTVMYIKKYSGTYSGVNYESIVVFVEGDFVRKTPYSFSFPAFNAGTMYKGMKTYKEYTLEELGL